eukprot:2612311-Rhodomonas_salina.1
MMSARVEEEAEVRPAREFTWSSRQKAELRRHEKSGCLDRASATTHTCEVVPPALESVAYC